MIASTQPKILTDLSNEAYHADHSAVSKSMLWEFWESPAMYFHRYVAKDAPPKKPTPQMEFGTLVHTALLEPQRLTLDYAVYPASVLSSDGKATTKKSEAFAEENAGKKCLTPKQFEAASAMTVNVRRVIGDWFKARPQLELSLYWTDEDTGLRCKCRTDFLAEGPEAVLVADIKTCADATPRGFSRSSETYGYWMQHEMYSRGVRANFGKPVVFAFVASESDFPHRCALHRFQGIDADNASYYTSLALEDLRDRMDRNDWSESWVGSLNDISLSRYAFSRGE